MSYGILGDTTVNLWKEKLLSPHSWVGFSLDWLVMHAVQLSVRFYTID